MCFSCECGCDNSMNDNILIMVRVAFMPALVSETILAIC